LALKWLKLDSWPIITSQRVVPKRTHDVPPHCPRQRRSPEMATSRGSSIAQWQRLKKPRATVWPIPIHRCKCS